MLDQTNTTTAESQDAFTLFALEPTTTQQAHPTGHSTSGSVISQTPGTELFKDVNGAVRLKLSA
jgi:hypothetical protein